MKLKGMKLKHILRSVSARYLPRELVYREKQGFGFPIALWLRNDLAHFLRNLFAESRFVEAGIFDQKVMQTLLDEHLSGKVITISVCGYCLTSNYGTGCTSKIPR